MERYDICPIDGVLMPDETGEWVKYEEAEKRVKELEEALKYAKRFIKSEEVDMNYIESALNK